ncbi:hypothetical protein GLOIN_2v680629 [Rhizophagus irregularis DAOM 181602=DAOM 197198]|uniref:MULE transposase domain-containing protein n=1 Tax=Rhizophagus irregularis (strain DAOM 181602 / DAOM 197198 / MUCL 43194) TaxID=747089 RepID=A0A2P4QLC8_RHIID|nr:hypothetical protein GLOIN_2v680629 [Rhizophagus irregularis DAOM 181602=DAOM 197198]POG78398.1 hypothetical protein GLOIN_2v680629 [Rhizophagus irregularis DAOM 181602=DAOM 197198]|eukprot:XP_025185264.1 hypothetical protein GLOIN_2v680629 [Rhizophagus irregularis DAOM 181602=DAOM 197198]
MTEKISNFSLNETLTNVELLHDKQHQNFLIIDSSSEDDIENPTLNLTLGQTFQTCDEAEKFLNDYALEKGFSIWRKRTENDDNKILRKISWECCCAVIDNCNRTRLVATALLEDETEESFIWALSMIKKEKSSE